MKEITRPVLRYHGGKFGTRGTVADLVASHFPPHRIYVEPFGGAASVLMRKERSYAEVYNDRWGGVVRVFRTLRDQQKGQQLEKALRFTPFARDEMDMTTAEHMADIEDDVEFTRRIMLRSFAGFGSAASNPAYNTGFRANANKAGTTPAHDWKNYPDVVPAFVERLQGVVIENRDALEVMAQHDTPQTLFYVDPPYVHSTRSPKRRRAREYAFEMDDADHEALGAALHALCGMVVLSGYHSELYDRLFKDWACIEFDAMADGAEPRTEVLWLNPAAVDARAKAQATDLFGGGKP